MQTEQGLGKYFFPHGEFRPRVLLALIRHQWFIRMRWIITVLILALLGLDRLYHPGFERPRAVAFCVAALAVFNVIWMTIRRGLLREVARQDVRLPELVGRLVWFVNAQMTVDLLILTVLLRFSGGIESPAVVFYLFHMLIAALLLRPINALLQGCWALLLFGGLVTGEYFGWISPHYPFVPSSVGLAPHANWTHVLGASGALAAGIFGTLYFTLQISSRLDEQEDELRAAVEALERSQAAIKDLQARRSRFMQTAAHQLKSPLAGVQTLTGLIHDGVVPAESIRPTCARIIQRCREGINQVTELLTLARIQQADPEQSRQEVANVRQVVLKLCQRYKPIAEGKQIELRWEVPERRDLLVQVDSASLADCVGNLVDNAIKYTPGPGQITVTVAPGDVLEPEGGVGPPPAGEEAGPPAVRTVSVTVSDTGMGIEPEALATAEDSVGGGSIFDAFLRGNKALAAGIRGTGLGLAIVREIVEQAGGRITVRSEPDRGSTFTVTFPTPGSSPAEPSMHDTRTSVVVLPAGNHRKDQDRAQSVPPDAGTGNVSRWPASSE